MQGNLQITAPIVAVVDNAPGWEPIIDETDPNNVYIGFAQLGTSESSPNWRIKKITKSGGIVKTLYAEGSIEFKFIWDNRATYSYSR